MNYTNELEILNKEMSFYSNKINEAKNKKISIKNNLPIAVNFVENFPLVKTNKDKKFADNFENFSFFTKSKSIASNIPDLNNHILEKIEKENDKNKVQFSDDDFYAILSKSKKIRFFESTESQERLCEICENLQGSLNQHFKKMDNQDFILLKKSAEKNQKSENPLDAEGLFNIYEKFTYEYDEKDSDLSKSIETYKKSRDISAQMIEKIHSGNVKENKDIQKDGVPVFEKIGIER